MPGTIVYTGKVIKVYLLGNKERGIVASHSSDPRSWGNSFFSNSTFMPISVSFFFFSF